MAEDRKSTRLNSSHVSLHDAVPIFIGAAQHARNIGADGHRVTPNGLGFYGAVKCGHFVDPHRRHIQIIGNGVHQLIADPAAVLFLGSSQRLDNGRAAAVLTFRKLAAPVVDGAFCYFAEQAGLAGNLIGSGPDCHLSTSPKTRSWVATRAEISAIMWPLLNSAVEARCP